MKPATLTPDQVIGQPGMIEATAIEHDYEQSMKGLRHFVVMGLRLMDVKARLAHGKFLPWCERFLPQLSPRHLQNAKRIAEGLVEITGTKYELGCVFDATLPEPIEQIVAGATGYKALLAEIQEFRQDSDEDAAREKCEALFADDPELRDEWEPRAISGELSWTLVWRGIKGQEATKEKRREDANYAILLPKSFTTLRNGFAKWDDLKPEIQDKVVIAARQMVADMPPAVKAAIGLPVKGGRPS